MARMNGDDCECMDGDSLSSLNKSLVGCKAVSTLSSMLNTNRGTRSQWVVRMRVDDVRRGSTTGRDLATKSATRYSVAHNFYSGKD